MMKITNITKWIVPALFVGLSLTSCSKDDEKDLDGNPDTEAIVTIVHEQDWDMDTSLPINQRVGSHRKTVGAVMEVGGKTYHHQIYNTGYQVKGSICEFNGSDWVNCVNSGYNINLAYTDNLIVNVGVWNTFEITTQVFDSDLQQWKIYEQPINNNSVSGVKIVSSNNTLLLATYRNRYEPIDLYLWNNTTKKWDLLIDDLENSENWTTFHILPGINNEFLFRIYEKDNNYSYKFYTLNDTVFSHLYTTKNYELINGLSVCNVLPYKGQYILIDGNVEIITGKNSTKPLVKGLSGGNIYSQISDDKLFLLSGTRPLNTYNITEVSVYDFNTNKLHLIGKSEPVAKTIGGQQLPGGWFTPTENGIHLITNLNSGVSGVSGSIVGEVKLLTYDLKW
ncbi:hypothetical protein [Pedobacter flavus]|uniref:Lipoprotein n=1 Tax=Pedobacter flavus TaxID=3113906 RepID=A0ABU7H236_9SPHI|nr:hypothetical protein [Pedobacter sp. VNH31]MEE1885354.1 hypothetical protein [Pedobacter sp. VNH31]